MPPRRHGSRPPAGRWRPLAYSVPRAPVPAGGRGAGLFGDPLMLQLSPQTRILLATEPVDFRKGIDGLAAVCRQQLREQPLSGAVFVFRNRTATALKLLVYDGQGFWLSRTVHNASLCDKDGRDALPVLCAETSRGEHTPGERCDLRWRRVTV